jgi:hypothetical protein
MARKVVSRATYWRRRVVVLAAAVAVLGLPIWAVNEALGGSRAPGQGQGSPRSSSGHVASAHSRASGHRQTPAQETADLGRARPSAGPPGASASPSPRPGRQTCALAVRLTLRSAQHRYGSGEQVIFVIGAVSTGSRPCRFDLGSKFTSVVVAFNGTPLWDSSSCLRGSGLRPVMLRRGAPAFLRITWDRRTSMSGCPGQGTAVRAGIYTAAAFNGQIRSPATAFVLSGRGAARP